MAKRITIDPVTRIEGHLRIDVEVAGGRVKDAWSSGTMWRGIELILQGRDPREAWLFTQRICGVCTTVHAMASVRAVENATKTEIPLNAQYIRNLIVIAHALHDHIVHFYHLSALDWVDVVSALKADPKKALKIAESVSDWRGNSINEFKAVQTKLANFVQTGQLGPFAQGYWGHPAMKLPPEVNLIAATHYLQALEFQRKANQIVAILGGKTPNIQNLAVGGVSNPINLDSQAALNMEKLYWIKTLFGEVKNFIHQVYIPDVLAVASFYPEWFKIGGGVKNYLAVPDLPLDTKGTQFDLPGGTIMGADLKKFKSIDSFNDEYFRDNVSESIARAYYSGNGDVKHPYDGETIPAKPDYDPKGKYSWVKAPRFDGKPMQVGPLAQVLMGLASGHEPTKRWVKYALDTASSLVKQKLGPGIVHSTLGRHLARALRCGMIAEMGEKHWELLVGNIGKGDVATFTEPVWPKGEAQGFGFHEAPRGVLSHWVVLQGQKIKNYQCVVPSTWNAGPRDGDDKKGPYEASLCDNHPVKDPDKPLELLRTVHSFDPCLACAVHTSDPEGRELSVVKAL